MFKAGIRNRLLSSFLLLIVLIMAALGGYILWFFHNYNIERLSDDLQTEAEIAGQLLHPYMRGPMQKAGLDAVLKELATKADRRLTIIDTTGIVLADSWENPALMENHSTRPEIMAALAGQVGKATRYSTTLNEQAMYIAVPVKQGGEIIGVLRMSTTLAHIEAGFTKMRNVLLFAFFLTTMLALLLSMRLARKYTAPIEEITTIASQMGAGQLDKRVHLRTGDELEVLGHTLNNLASSLDDKINEIMAEKRKLELVFENMDNAVILFDRYGRVIDANSQALRLFNFTPAMYGQHHVQVIGTSLLDKALKETILQDERQWLDVRLSVQGMKRVFQVFIAPTMNPDNGSLSVLAVFHDITALKEIEERQTDFVANASHELSTPLTAIKGFSETLLDGALQNPELSKKFVSIIHEESERMHRLVKDLLQLARISSRDYHQQIKRIPTAIQPVAEKVIRHLTPQLENKSLAVELHIEPKELSIYASSDWINQILVNLIENSIKFTPSGGKIFLNCRQEQDKAIIRVQDTGIGIPAEDLPFIFDRFYRVDRARTRAAGGTGLGLAIVKYMVEALDGTIEAKSTAGFGSIFTITFPVAPENPINAKPHQ